MQAPTVTEDEPILLLRNAIIEQAARDFVNRSENQMRELRRFFSGKWCQGLLDMDGTGDSIGLEAILAHLEEKRRKRREGKCRGTIPQKST